MRGNESPFWPASWIDPSLARADKPRTRGLTMVIDKGLGLHAFHDLLQLAAPYIDICKLGFGTSALYPIDILREKVELAKRYGVDIMPGGTFFELAFAQAPLESYLARLKALGFTAIEISDGTLPLSREMRLKAISRAADAGLTVYTEFGQKAAGFKAEAEALTETLRADLEAGAAYVIVEARESGNVGVFNQQGELDEPFLHDVTNQCGDLAAKLIWEAPQKDQQVALLRTLGLHVNLGNIAPADVLSVETLRRGLRGDTSAKVLRERRAAPCE
ncbi:phosphosulfolactate synthase [Brevibacillus sp. SYP-B805]|uniref:phosphosulfolactate synthase n=1 Tax=Brevibacillus sp. SYP-B805 TaxID=1578199 RepID=UPI0013ECFB04|nr:phosphosulfolactate synthase [Brevibacillus sp. SYP-B805]NGQ94725.1 phosphosulfolactate synthase [Brevibacillus sp. SYP-B805]